MNLRRPSYRRRILKAMGTDAANYVAGLAFSWLPLPWETVREIRGIRSERSPLNYTDWVFSNWPVFYSEETGSCASFLFEGKKQILPEQLVLDNTERRVPLHEFSVETDSHEFTLNGEVEALTDEAYKNLERLMDRKKIPQNDEENARLKQIVDGRRLIIQPVGYENTLRTNLVMDAKIEGRPCSLREYVHRDQKLEPLSESLLANQLGINVLLFAPDGSLVMAKRPVKVALRPRELCPAGSGTVKPPDLPPGPLDGRYLLRELYEETGLKPGQVKQDTIMLLGLTRELIRGGKPELFLKAETTLSRQEIKDRRKHASEEGKLNKAEFFAFDPKLVAEPIKTDADKAQFFKRFDELIEKHGGSASIPLLTNLALWQKERLASGLPARS